MSISQELEVVKIKILDASKTEPIVQLKECIDQNIVETKISHITDEEEVGCVVYPLTTDTNIDIQIEEFNDDVLCICNGNNKTSIFNIATIYPSSMKL